MTKDEMADALIKIHGEAEKPTEEENKKQISKTKRLIKLALDEAELFHDAEGKAYATIRRDGHHETSSLRSKAFHTWLTGRIWAEIKEGCGKQILQDALGTMEAHAIHEGSCHSVHVRLAPHSGRIYLDLGSDRHDVVEVTSVGWRVLEDQNIVKFRRLSSMAALPYPKAGGKIEKLKKYINIVGQKDFILVVAFILVCFHPSGPFPIITIMGEQGSAKSTLMRVIKAIVDASTVPCRSMPGDIRDLAIAAHNSRVLSFDNLSSMSGPLSDALCRLATGGGFATRTLYSDEEETIFDTKRPVMLNGIDNVIRRHDLADRAIIINLAAIPEEKRIPENEFWADFEDDAPEILGAILDAVSCALRNIDAVKLPSYPRMADFAMWVTAAEPALGWTPGTFVEVYRQNIHEVTSLTLDADLLGTAVSVFMEDKTVWEGTATELLDALEANADERTKKARGWPKAAHVLSGKLRLSATALRTHGSEVTFSQRTGKQKLIRLENVGKVSVTSVIERKNTVNDFDIKDKSPMTLSKDRSVTGASCGHEERHTDRMNDASRDANDAYLFRSVINPKNKTDDISSNYEVSDARDANDASIPPSFQKDDLREVAL